MKLASESEEKTWTILLKAIKPFLTEVTPQGSPSKQSEDGNPIFHPTKKSVPQGADLFFPALKACLYKQGKNRDALPQAKRTFLIKVNPGFARRAKQVWQSHLPPKQKRLSRSYYNHPAPH